ncbi:hypothetical protein [Pseudophaeobacter sp.]|uniref:hypothetical protein n=1 Tax=Pseudophaeobacter sp. TaxID=1971739 RepID=UPI00329A4FF0
MSDKENGLTDVSGLDDLFAVARNTPVEMPASLTAAILADASQVQELHRQAALQSLPGASRGEQGAAQRLWRQFSAAVGGWPSLGGLAAASLTGLWLGLAPPSFLPDPVASYAAFSSGSELISNQGYDVSLMMSDEVFE